LYFTAEEIAFMYETKKDLKATKLKEKEAKPDKIIYAVHLFVRSINICVYYYLMPLSLVLLNILYAFNYSHLSYVAPE
jgi:hypothetical protein